MSQELELRYLSEEELRKIIEKAISEGKEESRFILLVETWYRQGPSFIDEQTIDVIYGEAEQVELETIDEGYPYRLVKRLAVIPKTVPTIVLVEHHDNTVSPEIHEKVVYVFTGQGWKKIQVQ